MAWWDEVRGQRLPMERARALEGPEDEAQVIQLLRACYGESYGHGELYQPGTLQGLWASGRLGSLGSFTAEGALTGHTGLWFKDPAGDFVESGLSLVAPPQRGVPRDDKESELWPWLLRELASRFAFIHQQTTTLHPAAQRYAMHHMRARFAGWLPCYTQGESLVGLPSAPPTMHALLMTTCLRPLEGPILLPPGPHAAWLSELASTLGLTPSIASPWPLSPSSPLPPLAAELLEEAPGLGLRRRRLLLASAPSPSSPSSPSSPLQPTPGQGWRRVEVLHVPCVAEVTQASAAALYAAGFAPVGLRPGALRPHEVVWWRGEAPRLDHVALARPEWEASLRSWAACTAPAP